MGGSFSSTFTASKTGQPPTAVVINADGSLVEYSQPVEVSHVLGLNHCTFFLSDADELFYGHQVQALDNTHLIKLGKIYFFLPAKMRNRPLTAAEMAALAASANSAFADAVLMRKKKKSFFGRSKGVQVMPVVMAVESAGYESFNENSVGSWRTERSGRNSDEVKQRTLRRGKSALKRPFKARLSSIEEVYD